MTAQEPERLVHAGRVHNLCATPLEPYLARLSKVKRPRFAIMSTANWRGYVGTWEIVDDRLFLTAIEGWVPDEEGGLRAASLEACFPWRTHPIAATWVTDDLRCPEGRLRTYWHAGFCSEHERDRIFGARKGVVEDEWVRYNPPSAFCYRLEPDGTRSFFDGPSIRPEHAAPDPFPPGAPVEPWRLWGQPDHGVEIGADEGWLIAACLEFPAGKGMSRGD